MTDRASPSGATVTIVTHRGLPGGAADDLVLSAAFAGLGAAVRFAAWDDPAFCWSETSLAIVRSSWDYHLFPTRWRAWIDQAEHRTTLVNEAVTLRWNTDKRYLGDLTRAGIACVPTVFVEPGDDRTLRSVMNERNWSDLVVKPAIGASASGARRIAGESAIMAGETHLAELLADGAVLVQPYLQAVETDRERSLVFIDRAFTHAFTKPAFNTDDAGSTVLLPHTPTFDELALARSAIAASPGSVLYARVDMVPGEHGPILMELELIEPDLGLRLSQAAAGRLAAACLRERDSNGSRSS